MRFSQRIGITPREKPFQIDSMDEHLRNGLWNAVYVRCLQQLVGADLQRFYSRCWHEFFKLPLDEPDRLDAWDTIREWFFASKWYEVYDFLEFASASLRDHEAKPFREMCNEVLKRENSAYRFVDTLVRRITSEAEIQAVEEAIAESSSLAGVHAHLKQALALLSDRKNPDYRNSIKESISAAESVCKVITGDDKATLGAALKEIDKRISIHGALKEAFSKLYGWTSDEGGIRHALMEEENVSFSDAKFMLVACSAFVHYLLGKASDSGTPLGSP